MIENYHNFYKNSLLEKEEDIETKKNISYEKADTGKSSADSYRILLQEIFSAIDAMTTFVSPANPEVLKKVSENKSSLASSLKNNTDSHKTLLKGLISLSYKISDEMPVNYSTENISKEYKEQESKLSAQLNDKTITQEEYDEKLKSLINAADKEMEKSKDVYYQKSQEILKYYSEAIKAFSEGATKDLDTIEKEEAKEDIDSELNFTDWLSDITSYAESVLYGTKKAK